MIFKLVYIFVHCRGTYRINLFHEIIIKSVMEIPDDCDDDGGCDQDGDCEDLRSTT